MSGWAGFWIGCGLVLVGVGLGHIGDQLEVAARLLAETYLNTFEEDEEEDDVQS